MGRMYAEAFIQIAGKVKALECHLEGNFYPPLPMPVRAIISREFNKYWKEPCEPADLLDRINKAMKKLDKPGYSGPIGLTRLDHFDMFLEGDAE